MSGKGRGDDNLNISPGGIIREATSEYFRQVQSEQKLQSPACAEGKFFMDGQSTFNR